ncbi:prepilin-type N-terminal cleavage/methylation domain-containing protein [Thermodesulfobacteriota bacterium]
MTIHLKKHGFTLIEVMISLFLMSIMTMIVLPVFMSIMGAKSGMEKNGIRQMREGQAFMGVMREDLRSLFLSNTISENKFYMANHKDFEGNSKDEIYFTSFSHYVFEGMSSGSDQCEVGYFIKEERDKLSLYRKEALFIDDDLIKGGEAIKLIDNIKYFDLVSYADGSFGDTDEFSTVSEEPTITDMPVGIMIRLGLINDDGKVNNFETAILMPDYLMSESSDDNENAEASEVDSENTEDEEGSTATEEVKE